MVYNGADWMPDHRLLTQYGVLYAILFLFLLSQQQLSLFFAIALAVLPFLQVGSVLLKRSVSVSAEATSDIFYHLIDTNFRDPLGLSDTYIARYEAPKPPYGKIDPDYLVDTLKPSVMIWHWAGHMKSINQEQRNQYVTYCSGPCDNWNSFLVMIRADRADVLGPAFGDWKRIDLNLDWPTN